MPKTKSSDSNSKIITRAAKIAMLKPMMDENGEQIRHEWIDAFSAQHVFVNLFASNPNYKFGKTFPKANDYGMYSEVDDLWSMDIVRDKYRDGTSGYLEDENGKVRTDVPIIRRYIVGRKESKNRLIDGLIQTFNVFPDSFPNKEIIIQNLTSQKNKKAAKTITKKPPIKLREKREIKVATRSTIAAIPMTGLFQHVKGDDYTFSDNNEDTVIVELIDEGKKSYYKVTIG